MSATTRLEQPRHFKTAGGGIKLMLCRIERVRVKQALKKINLSSAELESLQAQRQELDDEMEMIPQEQKRVKINASENSNIFLES
jgi:hypothetical protein